VTVELGWAVLAAVVAGLANARLTRLVTVDEIFAGARRAVLRRLDPDRAFDLKVAYLLECGWCASVWWAAAMVAAGWLWLESPVLWAALSIMALSQVAGMLGDLRFYLRNRPRSTEND
jgi:hypothetical protein